jgi:hypothetical protein
MWVTDLIYPLEKTLMSYQNKTNFYITQATDEDNNSILELIESDQSKGLIEMMYTRRPNPYQSYHFEAEKVCILLLKNLQHQIKAIVVVLTQTVYINGVSQTIGYVTGLRKTKEMIRFNWLEAFSTYIKDHFQELDLYYFTVLEENIKAMDVFSKDRSYLPKIKQIGNYSLYFIKTGLKVKTKPTYTFRRASTTDEEAIIQFLNKEGSKYQLFPVVESIEKQFHDLKVTDFYILELNGKVVTVGALWNQQAYKQYMIKKYHGYLKLISKLPSLPKLLGLFKLPKEGEFANFATLSFLISKNNNLDAIDYFVKQMSAVQKKQYDFIVTFREDADQVINVFKSIKSIRYNSKIFLGYFKESQLLTEITKRPLYLECGCL